MTEDRPTMQAEHFITDMQLVIENIDRHRARLVAEIQEHGEEFTKEQEAKWEGAFIAVFGLLRDELCPCLRSWESGHPYSRRSELMLAGEEPDNVISEVENAE